RCRSCWRAGSPSSPSGCRTWSGLRGTRAGGWRVPATGSATWRSTRACGRTTGCSRTPPSPSWWRPVTDQPDTMAVRTTQARDWRGRFTRSVETAQRDAVIAEMKSRRMSYQQIADELGIARSTAHEAYQRVLERTIAEPAADARKRELEDLDFAQRQILEVLERQHVTVSHGRVVRRLVDWERDDDGEYVLDSDGNRIGVYEDVLDDGPILQAVDRLIKIGESRRKLLGLDAATKMDVSGTVTSRIIGVPDDEL